MKSVVGILCGEWGAKYGKIKGGAAAVMALEGMGLGRLERIVEREKKGVHEEKLAAGNGIKSATVHPLRDHPARNFALGNF